MRRWRGTSTKRGAYSSALAVSFPARFGVRVSGFGRNERNVSMGVSAGFTGRIVPQIFALSPPDFIQLK
jgi:hypothetical protein